MYEKYSLIQSLGLVEHTNKDTAQDAGAQGAHQHGNLTHVAQLSCNLRVISE